MKNLVSLIDVRKEWKGFKGSASAIVKQIYASIEGEGEKAKAIRAILPAKRQSAIDDIPAICKAYHVGEARKVTRNGKECEQIIKFSADMLLRYYTKANNEEANEETAKAKAEKRAKEKAERDAKKAKEQAEKDKKRAAKEEEKKAREEKAQKHLQVEKARTEERKREEKKNAKKNGKK